MDINMTISEERRIELGNYVRKIMSEKKLGFNQIVIKTKINTKPFSEIINGKQQKINPFYLQKIAYALKLDYKELYEIVGYLEKKESKENLDNIGLTQVNLSVYGKSNLKSENIDLESIIKKERIILLPGEELPKDAFMIDIKGDSMYPALIEGDIAIVDPVCGEFKDKSLYVVTYNGVTMLRRVLYRKDYIQLVSDNQDRIKYPDIIIVNKEGIDFVCNGLIIEVKRKYIR